MHLDFNIKSDLIYKKAIVSPFSLHRNQISDISPKNGNTLSSKHNLVPRTLSTSTEKLEGKTVLEKRLK